MNEIDKREQAAARIYLDLASVYEDTDPYMAAYHRECARAILQNDEVARMRAHRKINERLSEFMIGDYQDGQNVWIQWMDRQIVGSCNICQNREKMMVHEVLLNGSITFRVCQIHAKELVKELQKAVDYVDRG